MTDETVKTATRDESMDIASLLKSSKETEIKEKSPLEKMKETQANGGLGLVVDNKELIEKNKPHEVQRKEDADVVQETDEYIESQDRMIAAAKAIGEVERPNSPLEMAALMDKIDDYAQIMNNPDKSANASARPTQTETEAESTNESTVSGDTAPEIPASDGKEMTPERREIVNILIDKTGLGGEVTFTDEEKEKILNSTEIHLTEVEEVELESMTVTTGEKPFLESISEFELTASKVPVTFPASRFRAYMKGLSYGEMGDISITGENMTFDQVHKKLSVIYNKMINPSIGKFKDFEDFLKKFAYIDMDLAIYGLVVATFPEVDEIPLTCNKPECKKTFNHKFSPRTLIRFDTASDKFLETMKEVATATPDQFDKLLAESPTFVHKRYRLPMSKVVVEVGIASAYDYLYTIVDNLLGDKFANEHPDDVNGILQINAALLGLIRSVYIPTTSGTYVKYDKFEDMIQALYHIKPEEIAFLSSILQKYTDGYNISFELRDVVCPHCKTKTKSIPLDINYLVFLKYQRLMSTNVDIGNISVL